MTFRECPSKAELLDFFMGTAPAGKRADILEHICSCPECRAIFAAIREIQSEEEEILRGLERIATSGAARKRFRERAREEIRRLRPRRAFRRIWVPAAGAAVALLATVMVLRDVGFLRQDVERTAGLVRITLRQPKGVLSARVPDFVWTCREGVEKCRLMIYDRDLHPVFEGEPGASERFELPGNAVSSMADGALYFWKITAILKDGQTIESDFAKFVLQK
jgi:hypothetical protein